MENINLTEEKNKARQLRTWLLIVLVVAVAAGPAFCGLSPGVLFRHGQLSQVANAILGGLAHYDGTRTPGYPAFMALVGSDRTVYAVQLILGLGITLGWFLIAWQATKSPVFAGIVGLAHTLNPGQLFFEADLLTETLATFWLILALLGAWFWLRAEKNRTIWLGLSIGLTASLAVFDSSCLHFHGRSGWRFSWQSPLITGS